MLRAGTEWCSLCYADLRPREASTSSPTILDVGSAHEAIPASQLVVFPDAGHMPHHHDPRRFADTLKTFCDSTDAARLTTDHWQPRLDDDTA